MCHTHTHTHTHTKGLQLHEVTKIWLKLPNLFYTHALACMYSAWCRENSCVLMHVFYYFQAATDQTDKEKDGRCCVLIHLAPKS